jgi:hypothetical protein
MRIFYSSIKKMISKKTYLLGLLLITLSVSNNLNAQVYCTAAATSSADDEIFNVTFGTLNNTSICGDLGGAGSIAYMYNNYTSIAAPVVALGSNYPLSVTVGQCGSFAYSGYVGVWIDYNIDGDFLDAGEQVFMSASTTFALAGTVVTAPGGITIPPGATSGTTRMRVAARESGIPAPCGTFSWGEVEDYSVMILNPSPLDLGVNAIVNPIASKKCFGNDTIVARVRNYGSAIANFSVNPTVISVKTTGPIVATYTLALSSGTLGISATQDFTVSTAFNMSTLGTYKFKGYTTVAGDGSVLNDTTNYTVVKAPYFTTTVLPNDSVCLGTPVALNAVYSPVKTIGTGLTSNSSSGYPAPYGNFYWGAKNQFLFLASELSAAGLVAGNITSLAFNATNLNASAALANYNMAIATTTVTSLTTFTTTGLTTYFSTPSYVPVLGMNTHTLSTPYIWDGVSNIIIETCFNNSSFSSNVSLTQSTMGFSSSVYYRADIATVCSAPGVATSSTLRPNISFGQPVTVTYSWTPAIGLTSTSVSNPTANISSSKTYTVTSNMSGCMSYDTVHIHIKPTPTPTLGNDTTVCILPLVINANTTAGSFLWNTGATTSTINVSTSGKYWVKGSNTNGCLNTDTINIALGVFPIVTLGSDTAFCAGKTVTLYAGNPGSSYLWNTGATTSTIAVGTIGTYSVVVTNSTSCKSSDVINITSKPNPTVSLVFSGQTRFCPTETIRLLSEGAPSGGVYIGSGITGTNFNASAAGQGTYIIYYSYTASNGCSNLAKDTLIVNACVGVEELDNSLGLNVYPNPNSGLFTLEINASSEINAHIAVTSIDGRLVYEDNAEGTVLVTKSVNISELANGIYYLTVSTKDAKRTYKVLKQ